MDSLQKIVSYLQDFVLLDPFLKGYSADDRGSRLNQFKKQGVG